MQKAGEKLKKLRGKRTQREVADAIGVSLSAYCQYETGQRIPTDDNKQKLAKYYGRSVQFLFFD